MGLITGILLLPLAPVRGVVLVAEALREEAERELAAAHDPERALAELEAARALGEVSPEVADEIEARLVEEMLERHG